MSKKVAIIQARLGSRRLPMKMLLALHGRPIVEWVVRRVKKSVLLDDVLVAIPDTKENDILSDFLKNNDINVFRGSEVDVLERFYLAAKSVNADIIVRICADNPLVDPIEIDELISFYSTNKADYAYNHIPINNLYPDGLGAEIISFKVLKQLYEHAVKDAHREHCLSYITDNPDKFIIKTFDPKGLELRHPELRFDVDTAQDFKYLSSKYFDMSITSKDLINLFLEE